MKLIYKITLLVLAVLAIIACMVWIIVLFSAMWKMFVAGIALIAFVFLAGYLFILVTEDIHGKIITNYWEESVGPHQGDMNTRYKEH